MDSARWERIQALFHAAADLPVDGQEDFLKAECGDDESLRADVLAMLQEDARSASLLDRDLAHVASRVLIPPDPAALTPGEFGPYRLRQVLGEGGMGVVYLADREDVGSRVAIKILRDAWLSPARRERFTVEQRTLALLNHPSIASLYDADTLSDGTPWFAMEYVKGVPLTEHCRRQACPIDERLRLFRSVCEAVQYAHQHAVIHRDLKPSNILVKPDGSVRLLDFGIAKQLESVDIAADQTRTGLRLLTPAYAAPEQIRGERVGIHTDVYSLGVILYELLTGRLPFDLSHRTPGEVESMITGREPEKPSIVARETAGVAGTALSVARAGIGAWADLDVLCLTAMHKDPRRRYRSVEALIRDIDHFVRSEPMDARPDNLRYRTGKFILRNRRAVTAAALISALVLVLAVFFAVGLTTARNEAVAQATRAQRIRDFMLRLFQGGDAAAGPAENLRVVTLLDGGVREAESLQGEPQVQAELYHTLGTLYQKLGRFERADSLLQTALEKRLSIHGPDHAEVVETLAALSLLRVEQARLEEAELLAREALERSRGRASSSRAGVGSAAAALGRVLQERGRSGEAIEALEEAVRDYSTGGTDTPELATSMAELANTHFYAGNLDISEGLNRKVLEMNRRIHGERHPHVADDLINLGAIQAERGRPGEAEPYYRMGLDIIEAWYGKEHHKTASALTMLGRVVLAQGRDEEAVAHLQRALAIQERVYGPVHRLVASTLNELGSLEKRRGNLHAAEAVFLRNADIYRQVYAGDHYLIGIALSNLSSVYFDAGQYRRAEKQIREAVRIFAETLGVDHQNTGIGRLKLGRTLLHLRRFDDAESQLTAGYDILMKQTPPSEIWLEAARKDIAKLYEETGQPEKAEPYRAGLTSSAAR